jgi:tellurite resistance protein TehA-like permease
VLYVIAAAAYAILVVLFVVRLLVYPRRLFADLTSHAKAFTFLTIVAGTNVLASASAVVHGWWTLAEVLWWCSLPLYAVLVYTA